MKPSFVKQVMAGKSIGRILFNRKVAHFCADVSGRVVDLAGGGSPSYRPLLPPNIELVTTDYEKRSGVDLVVDLNKPLPFPNESEATLFCFNAIYILEDRKQFLAETHRVLQRGGRLFLSSPFMVSEIPEPHDYVRLTKEGLIKELSNAGFNDIRLYPFGERGSAAMYLLDPIFVFRIIRLPFYLLGIAIDKMLPKKITSMHPAAIGYFVIATK